MNKVSVSIFLDKRSLKSNSKYPVKLRVYASELKKAKLFSTVFDLTVDEFKSAWESKRVKSEFKDIRNKLISLELKAQEALSSIDNFTFERFEKILYRKASAGSLVSYHYNTLITSLKNREQLSTANTYELSRKSISLFLEAKGRNNFKSLTFNDVTVDFLKDYEFHMINERGRSLTTVSMYLRVLRAVFNQAIEEKDIKKDLYPFGKRKYRVPATKNVKKALNGKQLQTLFDSTPQTPEQEKAKDFWFFSYACSGMNIKDIALLRFRDVYEGKIEFIRAKTKLTSKGNQKPITIHLNDFSEGIINKYKNEDQLNDSFIFPILQEGLTPIQQQNKIKNFTRFINQHLKKLCSKIGLPSEISTYWARHSFATNAVRKGVSMEFLQESLGHNDIQTTQNYFAGFDDETKKEFSNSIMDFN